MLLIIVVWVYGRERFQRDVEFMTSQALQTWKINIVRFVTPIFLGVTLVKILNLPKSRKIVNLSLFL